MKKLSEEESNNLIDTMKDNFDIQYNGKVGIFWYDPKNDELFGVNKIEPSSLVSNAGGQKTISTLHRAVWQKNKQRDKGKGKLNSVWSGDHTQIPRGRIWQDESGGQLYVTIGNWIETYPQAKELIIDEFDLPQDVEFRYDIHWDLGHGFSGDII